MESWVLIMDLNSIWNSFLSKMEKELMPVAFEVWFKDTKLIELKDNIAKVLVQSEIYKKQMQNAFNTMNEEIFSEVTGSNFKFEYVTEEEIKNNVVIDTDKIGVPA